MAVRAIRGATSVTSNEEREILAQTRAMLQQALDLNGVEPGDIVSIVFVVTQDLDAAFPARAAREAGLVNVPLLDMVSPAVRGSMPRVIRMLLTLNTDLSHAQVHHVYLGEAQKLRPDLANIVEPSQPGGELR